MVDSFLSSFDFLRKDDIRFQGEKPEPSLKEKVPTVRHLPDALAHS